MFRLNVPLPPADGVAPPAAGVSLQDLFAPTPLSGQGAAGTTAFQAAVDYSAAAPAAAWIASYVVDWQWLATVVPSGMPLTVCVNWLPETLDSENPIARFDVGMRRAKLPGTGAPVTVVHADLGDTGLMHAKLLLVDFGTFMRVAVCTANLTADDWANLGQVVWCYDAPIGGGASPFADDLCEALDWMRLKGASAPPVARFNFTNCPARLVLSVPQALVLEPEDGDDEDGDDDDIPPEEPLYTVRANGFDCLQQRVKWCHEQLPPDFEAGYLIAQASSVGGISDALMGRLRAAAALPDVAPLRVLFPSKRSVQAQLAAGNVGAVTLRCFQQPSTALVQQCMVDLPSPLPFHSKVLFATDPARHCSWVCAGSHNLTSDSWCFDRRAKGAADPRNLELSVVQPIGPDAAPLAAWLPAEFFCAGAAPGLPDPFVFLADRAMIRDAGAQLPNLAGASPLTYHYTKFVAEYSNPFGRH